MAEVGCRAYVRVLDANAARRHKRPLGKVPDGGRAVLRQPAYASPFLPLGLRHCQFAVSCHVRERQAGPRESNSWPRSPGSSLHLPPVWRGRQSSFGSMKKI